MDNSDLSVMRNKGRICPLCGAENVREMYRDKIRNYFRCRLCNLIFVPPEQFLSAEDEKARYDLHQNSPDNPDYRKFLNRIFIPMQKRLAPGSYGLDFGSGPGPTLSVMFREAGHIMEIYDIFYSKDPIVLNNCYDFITVTEVVEHLHNSGKELDRLWSSLKPGGWLGIMTKLALDRNRFVNWHYKNDPTHVCFFSLSTFKWLAVRWRAVLVFIDKDVILFNKDQE